MSRRAELALAVVAALVVLSFVGTETLPALVMAGTLIVSAVVITQVRVMSRKAGSDGLPAWLPGAFAVCWLVVIVGSGHAVTGGSDRASGTAGIHGFTAVLYFSAVAGFAFLAVRLLVKDIWNTVLPAAMLALPVFAMASSLWSPRSIYALYLGGQLAATVVLAWATIELGSRHPRFLEQTVERFFRWLVFLTAVLVGLGVAFGGVYVGVGAKNLDRFMWIGAHPNTAGFVTAMAIVTLIGAPATALRFSLPWRLVFLGIVGYGAYGAQARTSMVALGAGVGVLVVLRAMQSWLTRYITVPYVLAAVLAGVLVFRDQALGYFYRDQDADTVSSGNGRSELWGDGFELLRTPFDWAFGLGYGQSLDVFLAKRSWATNAHSSVLGILVNLGIIGLALLAVWLVYTLITVYRSRVFLTSLGRTLPALLAFVIVHSIAAETVSRPGTGNALMIFIGSVSAAVVRLRLRGLRTSLSPPDDAAPSGAPDDQSAVTDHGDQGNSTAPAVSGGAHRRMPEQSPFASGLSRRRLRVRLRTVGEGP